MAALINKRECLTCKKKISGNENKKFCSDTCKNVYHNSKRKQESGLTGKIISILKSNRKILEILMDGKSVTNVKEQALLDNGFVFRYHTHNRVNQGDKKEYIFCFEYGYCRKENGWFTIVKNVT